MARIYRIDVLDGSVSDDERVFASNCTQEHMFENYNIAFGVFDGVHLGHMSLVKSALNNSWMGEERGAGEQYACELDSGVVKKPANTSQKTAVLTFDKDPDEVLFPGKTKKLQTNEDRILMLSRLPIDAVFVLPFTHEFSQLIPDGFLQTLFGASMPASIHVGQDFRFGCEAKGSVCDLKKWGERTGCKIVEVPLVRACGEVVSSTRIRNLLTSAGERATCTDSEIAQVCDEAMCMDDETTRAKQTTNLQLANRLLGREFSVTGVVREGRHEGASFGFATANLHIADKFDVLESGVYAAYAHLSHVSRRFKTAVSVGVSPTFNEAHANIEAHILDFDSDIYGKKLTLEFVEYLRPMKKFENTEALIECVSADIALTRQILEA